MSWLVIAWRNLWRNHRRTYVTLATIAASTSLLVLFQGLMVGMLHGTVANLTDVQLGQVQVHAAEYRKRPSMYRTVEDAPAILAWADAQGVRAAPRSFGAGLVGHAEKSAGANIWGVDPARERRAFKLAEHMLAGQYLDAGDPTGAVIGSKLARSIDAEIGDELIVVVAAADGSIGNELWQVRGILSSMGEQIDRAAVMIPQSTFEEIFVSGGRVHEIALTSRSGANQAAGPPSARNAEVVNAETLAARTREIADAGDEVASWRDLMPTMAEMVDMSGQYNQIFAAIFFLAAGIGILNTMLMAAYERIPEMGLVKALGASPARVFLEMTAEVVILSSLGSLCGMLIGLAATLWFSVHGIDSTAWAGHIEINGVVWDPIWRTHFDLAIVIGAPLSLMPVAILAGAYPALIAARVVPVQALRRMS
jgi:ABC-type lipoprotein release transport system permease subunit